MTEGLTLVCPIRGVLRARATSADGLKPSEEKLRIDAIRHLIGRGYPSDHIKVEAVIKRFGAGGRNSFRADLAVLDVPVMTVAAGDIEDLLRHALVLGEVKRESRSYDQVRHTQVKPMLDFATRDDCIALYWDDVEQRVFWYEHAAGRREPREGPISFLPRFGTAVVAVPLTLATIQPTDSLLAVFKRIEDELHAGGVDAERRYGVMLQLLLAKLYDEYAHATAPGDALDLQDFRALGTPSSLGLTQFNDLLSRAVAYYRTHLPRPVSTAVPLTGDVLANVLEILAPVKITASSHSVIQDFYMHFAKDLYRWDLAQYFTPTTVTDFIVETLSPRFGEHVKDPACGSADFLTAAFRIQRDPSSVWGSDNSTTAVQVAVLNMLLNGDGKSNIREEDSLATTGRYADQYDIVVCNPPFGTRIVDRRPSVLRQFDLAYEWRPTARGRLEKTARLLRSQETGILFTEACVRQAKPGGRVGIILPNGYLGNRSFKYVALREWLLRNCRIASICSFPRFTFKTSGADVSASVVFMQKRETPLASASNDNDYEINVELIESVGWNVGNKRAEPLYRREPADGTYIVGADGERELDSDFAEVTGDIRQSGAARLFPWLAGGPAIGTGGWSIPIGHVLDDPTLCLDPKRHSRKVAELRAAIEGQAHFTIGDVVTFVPERRTAAGGVVTLGTSDLYRYVEIQDIGAGDFSWTDLRGWQLPTRAKHRAEPGDIYVGAIWGSVSKWFMAGRESDNLVVTNGCHRLRIREGMGEYLVDLVAGLCTEAFATQMRAFARGSDGLAEVSVDDAANVLLPRIVDPAARAEVGAFVDQLLAGSTTVKAKVSSMIELGTLPIPQPRRRSSHAALV